MRVNDGVDELWFESCQECKLLAVILIMIADGYIILSQYSIRDYNNNLLDQNLKASVDIKRKDSFRAESLLPKDKQISPDGYTNSGYDKGHLTPANDAPDYEGQKQTFSMINMVPPSPKLNQQNWRKLESNVQFMILNHGDAYILTGSKPPINHFITSKSTKHINIPDKLFNVSLIQNNFC